MTKEKDTGGFAFPCTSLNDVGDGHLQEGMTLRDYYAGQALQGLMSKDRSDIQGWQKDIVWKAYSVADKMIEERDKN